RQRCGVLRREVERILLVAVDTRPLVFPALIRSETRGPHPPLGDETFGDLDVDPAPGAARPARRPALAPRERAVLVRDGVDPAEAQSFGYGLRPGHAALRVCPVAEFDPQLGGRGMVAL